MWISADEGNLRVSLLINALKATAVSPLFGFGVGSFSGIDLPFKGIEAHNNFLDLAMQFGFIFPSIVYLVMISAMVKSIGLKDYILAAVIAGYIVSGLFHFSARHFIFWLELGLLLHYLYLDTELAAWPEKKHVRRRGGRAWLSVKG